MPLSGPASHNPKCATRRHCWLPPSPPPPVYTAVIQLECLSVVLERIDALFSHFELEQLLYTLTCEGPGRSCGTLFIFRIYITTLNSALRRDVTDCLRVGEILSLYEMLHKKTKPNQCLLCSWKESRVYHAPARFHFFLDRWCILTYYHAVSQKVCQAGSRMNDTDFLFLSPR